ncbi:MAG TPA: phosphatase PAP2 family protein [Gaiellaceae bacterium]
MKSTHLVPLAAASWLTLAALAVVFWAGASADEAVAHPPSWARAVGEVGGWAVIPAGTVLLGLALVLAGRARSALFFVPAVAGAGVLAYAAKVALQVVGADDDGGRISNFPSTHEATTVAFTGALAVLVWRGSGNRTVRALIAVAAVTASVAMGWSRVTGGFHSVIDVAGGAALGVAWLATWMLALASIKSLRAWLAVVLAVSLAGFALLAVAYDEEPLGTVDREVAEWVAVNMWAWAEWLARPFSWLGGWIGLTPIAVGLVLFLLLTRRFFDAAWAALTISGIQLVTAFVKEAFDRPRPHEGSAVALPSSDSFPSGHAAGAVVTFGVLAVLGAERWPRRAPLLWALAALLSLAVGTSRVVLNIHYVTDVLAGWCLGVAWLAGALLMRRMWKRRSLSASASSTPTARGR